MPAGLPAAISRARFGPDRTATGRPGQLVGDDLAHPGVGVLLDALHDRQDGHAIGQVRTQAPERRAEVRRRDGREIEPVRLGQVRVVGRDAQVRRERDAGQVVRVLAPVRELLGRLGAVGPEAHRALCVGEHDRQRRSPRPGADHPDLVAHASEDSRGLTPGIARRARAGWRSVPRPGDRTRPNAALIRCCVRDSPASGTSGHVSPAHGLPRRHAWPIAPPLGQGRRLRRANAVAAYRRFAVRRRGFAERRASSTDSRCRKMRRMGVPRKPHSSRIRFSR